MKKSTKISLLTAAATTTLSAIAFIGVGKYFYDLALNPKSSKEKVIPKDKKDELKKRQLSLDNNWITTNSPYMDIYTNSKDNLSLHSYMIPNIVPTDTWVITIHGYMSEGRKMDDYAKHFYNDMGFNVLVPDLRGHGFSEGDYIGMGWHDKDDILVWINQLVEMNPECKIILHGVSMGGATVMMTAGENLPSNVIAAIEDCGYKSVYDQFKYKLETIFNLPNKPIMSAANMICRSKAGYSFKEASAIEQLKNAKIPMLFMHGSEDDFVPYSMLDEIYESVDIEKEKVVIEGAGHANSNKTNPDKYWSSIKEFINKYA